jgi:hypothetical protein
VLGAGEGPDEDLDTWRRAAAAVAQSSPTESKPGDSRGLGGLFGRRGAHPQTRALC